MTGQDEKRTEFILVKFSRFQIMRIEPLGVNNSAGNMTNNAEVGGLEANFVAIAAEAIGNYGKPCVRASNQLVFKGRDHALGGHFFDPAIVFDHGGSA
jgi:hypothetical protein